MSERRLHVASLDGDTIALGPDAAHHARVLRLGPGDRVVLFDGRGSEADAVLEEGDRARVLARRAAPDDAPRVVLVLGMPKGSKLDDVVRSATECGVAAIHLAHTERSVARPEPERARTRLDRLAKIAVEAARQSERASVPALAAPAPLAEVARRAPAEAARLVLSPRRGRPWAEALGAAHEAWCVVGPEGGLSDAEEDALVTAGWSLARLALPVLRVESAAPVAVALLVDAIRTRSRGRP